MKSSHAAFPITADPHLKSEAWEASAKAGAPLIDLVHLTRQTTGDKRLESELLRLFMRQSEQIRMSLDAASDADDRPAVSSLDMLHMLSGSARAIGATEIAALAGRIEAEIRRGEKTDPALAERRALVRLLSETNDYIEALLDQG